MRFDTKLGGFDDEPLHDFIKDKQVVSIREHFFISQDTPHLAVVITYYLPPVLSPAVSAPARKKEDKDDWRDWVTEVERPLFNALRDWRWERCQQLGVPPYVVATNLHLAKMAQMRPQSLEQLRTINRFGKSRIAKYGHDILAIVAKAPSSETKGKDKAEHAEHNDGNSSQPT